MRATTFFEQQEISAKEAFIEEYMRTIDMPDWYRGLSSFQLRATNGLMSALRDDLEQNTTYRVRNILIAIGLRPMVSKDKVRFTMKLSRGNDLAFLWFLKDSFYKSDEPTESYNLNEQILLTCIAHLDLLFTLRGLDSVLPPEQKPRKSRTQRPSNPFYYINKQLSAKQLFKPTKIRDKRMVNKISSNKKLNQLPYLNVLRKPKPYGKSLSAQPPDFVLRLRFLDAYKDPNYIIPNAANRWFADYKTNEARHTANSIIHKNLDEMFHLNIAKMPNAVFDAHVYKNLKLPQEPGIDSMVYEKKLLCEHHQVLEELEQNLEHELKVIAYEKCLKYFDVEASKKEKRIARLRKQIENDVNTHMQRFKELTMKSQGNFLITSKDNIRPCSKCSYYNELRSRRTQLCADKENKSRSAHSQDRSVITECGVEHQKVKYEVKRKPLEERKVNNPCVQERYRQTPCGKEIIGDGLKNNKHFKSHTEEIFVIPSDENVKVPRLRRLCSCGCSCNSKESSLDSTNEYVRNYNYGHSEMSSSLCSAPRTYFKAPKTNQPFKFDYPQIFDMKSPHDPRHLRKMCAKAIARDDDDINRVGDVYRRKCKSRSKESVRSAINEYTERNFMENIRRYNEADDERLTEMKIKFANSAPKYYDPKDKELMHNMLKDGLKKLATDARYVLPTLPDAHKMPVLRFWMYARYGRVYTAKELLQIFKKSLLFFRTVNKLRTSEKVPTSELIGRAIYTNYSCHDYLLKKTDHVRDLFYKSMDRSIMEKTRRLFMAMSPYLCTGRPQYKTIFAYLPARPCDIHHFHVWSSLTSKKRSKKSKSSVF
ncbi:uncharacterized protein [Eurosta solidaginis]|uniref:uncharacterized protein n=1 Tax=Eurosta solidaginis TaxID=178769 RepID=UPI0035306F7E